MGGDHDGDQVLLIWDQEMPGFLCVFLCLKPQLPDASHPYARLPFRKIPRTGLFGEDPSFL